MLFFSENANVTTLAPLRGLSEVGRGVEILRNPRLKNLDGLQGLRELPGAILDVSYNDSLESLVGLEHLESQSVPPSVGQQGISISHNRRLVTLVGLEGLRSITAVYITDNSALVDIGSLRTLRKSSMIVIASCPLVESIGGLAGLDSCGLFQMEGGQVADIGPLKDVALGSLALYGSPVSMLPAFSRIREMESVDLVGNSRLTSCSGLGAMVSLRYLTLSHNDAITSLAGFGGLHELQRVTINGNAALCTGVVQAWLGTVSVVEPAYVEGNGACR